MRRSSSGSRGPVSTGFMVFISQSSIVDPREIMECRCGEPPGSPAIRAGLPGERLEVVPASADCVAGHAEERQDHADYDDDETDRPENGDPGDEADNEEKNAKDNHEELLAAVGYGEDGIRIFILGTKPMVACPPLASPRPRTRQRGHRGHARLPLPRRGRARAGRAGRRGP